MARKHNSDEHVEDKARDVAPEAEETEVQEPVTEPSEVTENADDKKAALSGKFTQCWQWLLHHKKFSIPAAAVIFLAVLAAVPFTRYALAGLVFKQSYPVVVVDAETDKPVSSATVSLAGVKATTDGRGRATLKVKVGTSELQISKKYYKDASESVLVPIGKPGKAHQVSLQATGRVVPVAIVNKVSKQGVAGITITTGGVEAKTDKEGKAILVLPPAKKQAEATLSGEGYNEVKVTVTVTGDEVPANTFEVTPGGKMYFLSNASGKLDLVKSDLDGSNRQTVLAGTGKEDRYNTVLVASRDWKYIALLSKRDGGEYAKLFLVEAGNDKVTTMDEGDASFEVIGWSGDRFVYKVNREKVQYWQAKRTALKSYSASAKKITILDETTATGDQNSGAHESIGNAYIFNQDVLYVKTWNGSGYYSNQLDGKQASFMSVKPDATQKKVIKGYPQPPNFGYIPLDLRIAEFGEFYLSYYDSDGKFKADEYAGGKVTTLNITENEYYNQTYHTYLVSPSGNKTLWSDFRDGKYVIFVGDEHGENGKQIGSSEDYTVYGWYGDDYVLLTKKGSEMRILPVSGLDGDLEKSLKVTDYYKPNYYNRGYGYGGYGG